MGKCFFQMILAVVVGVAGLGLSPNPASASYQSPASVKLITLTPPAEQPIASGFSDREFEAADQAELGALAGGEIIIVGGLLVLLVVVFLFLFLLFLFT